MWDQTTIILITVAVCVFVLLCVIVGFIVWKEGKAAAEARELSLQRAIIAENRRAMGSEVAVNKVMVESVEIESQAASAD